MFGRFVESCARDPEPIGEATAAFQALVDALVDQQRDGGVRKDDPQMLARFVWSLTHGIGGALFGAVFGAAAYLAIEPFVRRRLPHLLVGSTRLFEGRYFLPELQPGRTYDVSPDSRRFLMIKPVVGPDQPAPSASLVIVQNWFEELKRLAPATR